MDIYQEFLRIMSTQDRMALATSVDGQPDVRMVSFSYNPEAEALYFVTYLESRKVEQIKKNGKVAFITLPAGKIEYVRGEGVAGPSSRTIEEVAPIFEKKRPGYMEHIRPFRDRMSLFEITFHQVRVILSDKVDHLLQL